jgi:hypothetical protein
VIQYANADENATIDPITENQVDAAIYVDNVVHPSNVFANSRFSIPDPEGNQDPSRNSRSSKASITSPSSLLMTNVSPPENTINTKDLSNPRINKLSSDLREWEHVIRSILLLTTGPMCHNCSLDLVRQSRITSPMSVLTTAGSNKAQLPQVDEASDNLDEPGRVVNEITERKAKAPDQFALAGDDLRDHIDKLACAGGLEEDSVVVKIEPGLRTGLHRAKGTSEVVNRTDVSGLLVDLDEWRRWH